MISVGIVTFGFANKRECKKLSQRIKTVTRQLQSYTHPVEFKRIEAADYNPNNTKEKEDWKQLINKQDGFIFLFPKHSENIKDDLTHSLQICSPYLKNKPLLLLYFGVENKFGNNIDIVDLARSFEMQVLYKSVDLPYLDKTRASAFDLFQQIESETLSEIEKLLYWSMGMKYTRTLLRQQDSGSSS